MVGLLGNCTAIFGSCGCVSAMSPDVLELLIMKVISDESLKFCP